MVSWRRPDGISIHAEKTLALLQPARIGSVIALSWLVIGTPAYAQAPSIDSFSVVPADPAEVVRIMPIGDSITHGRSNRSTYRHDLWHMLDDTGYPIDFVGSDDQNFLGPPPEPDFDLDHEGHDGERADWFVPRIHDWVVTHGPEIALIHLGTNDITAASSAASTIADLEDVIDEIRRAEPGMTIALAQIIPAKSSQAAVNQGVLDLNALIPSIATSMSTAESPVIIVDHHTGYDGDADNRDNLHPNASGEAKMAQKWFDALEPELDATDAYVIGWATSGATSVSITPGIGAVSATGTLRVVTTTQLDYTLTATGPGGSVDQMIVLQPQAFAPFIATEPADRPVLAGGDAEFDVVVRGSGPLSYQWERDGAAIPGATSATLSLSGVTLRDGGASFRCVITGPGGTVISRDATLFVGSNLARSIEGLQLLYAFDEGAGAVVEDVSGVSPALDLEITSLPATHWLSGGLSIDSATILSTPGSATRLHTALGASNETTIEAWVRPANITQTGPARIVTLSENSLLRNFTLGQRDSRWAMRVRTTIVTDNGLPELLSATGTLTTALHHVAYTRAYDGTELLYLDGGLLRSGTRTGMFSGWNPNDALALANEFVNARPWLGELYLVAIYDRALSGEEVALHFTLGSENTAAPPVCGNLSTEAGEACDDGGTSSGDGCSAFCEFEDIWTFTGMAVGGFPVQFTVSGVVFELATAAGESAEGIAQRVADAINADPTLQGLPVDAIAVSGTVYTNGVFDALDVGDPGLNTPGVPALQDRGVIMLSLLLLATGLSLSLLRRREWSGWWDSNPRRGRLRCSIFK